MAGDPNHRCLNCEHPVEDAFCPACGQKRTDYRVSLWHVLKEILGEAFELDGRVPRTLVPFLFKPGVLTREYNAGRRARYTSPFRLFLAMTLLWLAVGFVVSKTTDYEAEFANTPEGQVLQLGATDADGERIRDPEALPRLTDASDPEWAQRIERNAVKVQTLSGPDQMKLLVESSFDALPKAALVLLPVFALILKLLFLGTGRYYVEHLIFALHIHAFAFFILTLSLFVGDEDALGGLLALGLLVYVVVALRTAYAAGWIATFARLVGLGFVYGICAVITIAAFIGAALVL